MKKILVLNFFPAFVPPSSGGELRYFNMYSHLSAFFDVTLLSPTYAEHTFELVKHSGTFREYRIPKDESIHHGLHHRLDEEGVCAEVSALVCALSSAHPNEYHRRYFDLYEDADIIVHEFPYMVEYDMLWGFDDKPRVYNSHNVEYLLMKQLYRGEKADAYLQYIFGLEKKAVVQSDLVFATSEEEKEAFISLYGVPAGKISLAPNGIDPEEVTRIAVGGGRSALFIGSQHPPNVEAVDFIMQKVAPECPDIDFLIAGSCGTPFLKESRSDNVRLLGRIDEKTKKDLFASVDVAVNPMFSGAGTNLKTLEFLSAGIPLISTDIGVRGLGLQDGEHFVRAGKENFAEKIRGLMLDERSMEKISRSGRLYVNDHYSWINISKAVRDAIDSLPVGRKGPRKRILLLNDFRASSPTGGGEIRINRLYGALSRHHDILLLCLNNSTQVDRYQITQTFTEISFPKTKEHVAEEKRINDTYWVSASDIVSSYMVAENLFYTAALKAFYAAADLVVLIHPYMLRALDGMNGKPLIYESLNFEYGLKNEILKFHPLFKTLLPCVESVEKEACRQSSLVVAVSREDADHLIHFSGIPAQNAYVVRNGVDIRGEDFFADRFEEVKKLLHGHRSAVFIGSGHGPNVTALRFVVDSLAPQLSRCIFLIIGTVCNAFKQGEVPANVLLFGRLDDEYKEVLLKIADVAINPMIEGSGSNLKLAEYMANKLPAVTTKMGSRGYEVEDGSEVVVCELAEFAARIESLLENDGLRQRLSEHGYAYACRELDWNVLADEYLSILGNTVFTPGKKKLLVLTYRFTDPPLGGAEMYLLSVIRELDRIGDFVITVATTDMSDIFNKFHFSVEFTRDEDVPLLSGLSNTSVHKFRCDTIADERRLASSRRLYERWMEESVLSSLRHLDRYTFPLLLGGWHFPENNSGRIEIWSSGTALIYVSGTEAMEIEGYNRGSGELSLSSDLEKLGVKKVKGNFRFTVKTAGFRLLKLNIGAFTAPADPRPLGIRIVSIKYKTAGRWHNLSLNYGYRDYLKEKYLDEYIEELIGLAESRPLEYDELFQYIRGPVSYELEKWLDKKIDEFDVVLGHSVPFLTSVLATKYARKYDKPVVILPHFHIDDEFYHWKSYYDALRYATAVFVFPRRSIDVFYRKIGVAAHYIHGGAVYKEEHADVDSSDFLDGYAERLPFFLVLGRKAGAKNYRWAIDAVKKVNANKKMCNLVIIGRDEDGERIDGKDAFYPGERDRNVVLGALKECVALINMSESESFGIVILEAWMQRKPVIVNERCGAFAELVDDAVDGLLANRDTLADKIMLILERPAQAQVMGEKGFEKVQKEYTWESIGRAVNNIALGLRPAYAGRPAEVAGRMFPVDVLSPADTVSMADVVASADAGQDLVKNDDFESRLERVYEAVLRKGDIAIDVGAHTGRHCIPMAKAVCPGGTVFAFEPLPMCREYLASQVGEFHKDLTGIIKIFPFALSDRKGKGEFVVAKDALAYSGLKERVYDIPTGLEKIQVAIETIDNMFLQLPSLRYIKIDAEGGEFHIMMGAAQCIQKFRPLVSFEFGVNSIGEYGITPDDVARFWLDNGYRIYDIRGNLMSAPSDFVQSATLQNVWDYIAVPAENKIMERAVADVLAISEHAVDQSEKRAATRPVLDSADSIEKIASLHKGNVPHEEDFLFFRNLPPGEGIFLDVGANAGQSAVSFRCVDKNRRIVSFEPNYLFRPVLQYVKENLLKNFDFSLCGLGNMNGTVTLIVPYVDEAPFFQECSVDKSQFEKPWVKERLKSCGADLSFGEMDIQIVKADDLNLRPDIVKIDAEGFELAVLEGMERTILSYHPVVLIENNDYERVTAFLKNCGYDVFSYRADENKLRPPRVATNSFYLHKAHHASLIERFYRE